MSLVCGGGLERWAVGHVWAVAAGGLERCLRDSRVATRLHRRLFSGTVARRQRSRPPRARALTGSRAERCHGVGADAFGMCRERCARFPHFGGRVALGRMFGAPFRLRCTRAGFACRWVATRLLWLHWDNLLSRMGVRPRKDGVLSHARPPCPPLVAGWFARRYLQGRRRCLASSGGRRIAARFFPLCVGGVWVCWVGKGHPMPSEVHCFRVACFIFPGLFLRSRWVVFPGSLCLVGGGVAVVPNRPCTPFPLLWCGGSAGWCPPPRNCSVRLPRCYCFLPIPFAIPGMCVRARDESTKGGSLSAGLAKWALENIIFWDFRF